MTPARKISQVPAHVEDRSILAHRAARHASNQGLLTQVLGGNDGNGARLAGKLLRHFGSLRGLAHASISELLEIPGVTGEDATKLQACLELGRRTVYGRPIRRRSVEGPEDVARLLMPVMRDLDREHFVAVLLTTKNQVIDVVTVSIGSLSASLVHPREVLKPAIQASAAALVVAHNHPTGVATPSQEDVVFTQRLGRCADLMGIRLLDHLIIGDGRFESMKARGHL